MTCMESSSIIPPIPIVMSDSAQAAWAVSVRRHRIGSSRTSTLIAADRSPASVVAVAVADTTPAVVVELMAVFGLVGEDLVDEVTLLILAIVVTMNDFVLVEVVVVDEVVDVVVVAVVEVIDVVGVPIVDNLAVGLAVEDMKDIN